MVVDFEKKPTQMKTMSAVVKMLLLQMVDSRTPHSVGSP
jgi:hypothetical protein